VASAEDQDPVEAVGADGADPSLRKGVAAVRRDKIKRLVWSVLVVVVAVDAEHMFFRTDGIR
jgi:hypothetical protein